MKVTSGIYIIKCKLTGKEAAKNRAFPEPALATRLSKEKELLRQRGGYSCWPGYKPRSIFGWK